LTKANEEASGDRKRVGTGRRTRWWRSVVMPVAGQGAAACLFLFGRYSRVRPSSRQH